MADLFQWVFYRTEYAPQILTGMFTGISVPLHKFFYTRTKIKQTGITVHRNCETVTEVINAF